MKYVTLIDVSDLLIKVKKAEEAVSKIESTLTKLNERELKQRDFLITKGVDLSGKCPQNEYIYNNDLYWEIRTWLAYKKSVEIYKKLLDQKKSCFEYLERNFERIHEKENHG